MRSEQEMMELILNTAKNDDRVRAVYMNGSRTNKNVPRDIFQDYDIVYVVKEMRPFYENRDWVDIFGERLYMQCPEAMDREVGLDVDFDKCFGWLMQFADGNRMDLRLMTAETMDITEDKLCVILLDKDGILPAIPEPTDQDYWIKKPSQAEFAFCCNEFWWCMNNIAKGLWREEIPYVQSMYHDAVHPQLVQLLNWKIGYETGFSLSTGKASKYMKNYLSADVWARFLKTYISSDVDAVWESVFTACDLFQETAAELERTWGHTYNYIEADNSYAFLLHVRDLPQDAQKVY